MVFIENQDLMQFNAYKLSSKCRKAYFPNCESDLISIMETLDSFVLIGNGNNIILSKEKYDENFIILHGCFDKIEINENVITAEAGATIEQISQVALEHGLSGFEPLSDIPSSIGGAVFMNAGTKEGEIKDLLTKVRFFDKQTSRIIEMSKTELNFEYRNSTFQKNPHLIVLKAWFKLERGHQSEIKSKMEQTRSIRWAKQPRDFPNCGSVFKRPPGRFVGPMLDELGLKGFAIGGAQVSEKHSGFIVNKGNATGEDILALIYHIKQLVLENYHIELEVEQRII